MHHAHLDPACKYYFTGKEMARFPLDTAMTYEYVYAKFMSRIAEISKQGWNVRLIWCCQIESERTRNVKMDFFFKIYEKDEKEMEPIQARDALFG